VTEQKGPRVDLLIAICALFISTLATGASWWQSRVVQQQLSAQVWPYLAFDVTLTSTPAALQLAIVNYGLGPALIRDIVIAVDGQPQHDMPAALAKIIGNPAALAVRKAAGGPKATFELTSLDQGAVVRASETRTLVDVSGSPALAQRLIAAQQRLDMRVCYCSILEQCWRVALSDPGGQPQAATCDTHDPDRAHSFDLRAIQKYTGKN
jgi:hypothetical protein